MTASRYDSFNDLHVKPTSARLIVDGNERGFEPNFLEKQGSDTWTAEIPNVLVEAQSQGLACVSTRVSAVPELVLDGDTGLLVEARDRDALGAALARAIADPALRARLGGAAERRVRSRFGADAGLDTLFARFAADLPRAA